MSDASSVPASDIADRPATGLRLDARQRAMLEEMGVKVWWPAQRRSASADAAEAEAGSPEVDAAADRRDGGEAGEGGRGRPTASVPAARSPAAPAPATPAPGASASASAMRLTGTAAPRAPDATAAPEFRPSASVPARAPASGPTPPAGRPSSRGVPGVAFDAPLRLYTVLDEDGIAPPPGGGWLVVADMPPEADGRHGEPFAGEAGRLLDNMLRALQLHDGRAPVHLMRTRRAAAPAGAAEAEADFASLADGLAPRLVLALGPLAAQSLLQSTDPLGRLRGRAAPLRLAPAGPLHALPVVVSYPPAYLLRNPADKARAWADLCLAADCFATPADTPAA